ncbi:MAG: DUF3047 domain-containing protein [Planctomycetes bacterium]|nr:DUF3047 domain-containing protein [Planctomycetota bacterium]
MAADYRQAFPRDKRGVPRLTGVLLKCDTNNTETRAEAWVRSVELVGPAPPQPANRPPGTSVRR